ncbi:MAG: PAS domain S-box protein [Thiotrichaceae bacterium]
MSAQKQQTSNIIPYPNNGAKQPVENVSIFRNEEQVISHAMEVIASYETHEHPLVKEYLLLLNDYKKLLKQTKFLVKISDKQQKDKTRQAEEVVETSEKRLAQFLEAVSVGIFVVDAQGKPHYANHKAQQIFGTNPVLCQNVAHMPEVCKVYCAGTQELYPATKNPILLAIQGYTCSIDDIEIHHADKVTPIAVWSTPIFDEKGNVIYAITVSRYFRSKTK